MGDDSSSITTTKRPLAKFHSTVWGEHFLFYTPLRTEISSREEMELEELKEKVRQMLAETPDDSTQKLVLIDTIQRLGVAYHFQNEIEISIQNIFNHFDQHESENGDYGDDHDDDLNIVALRFRLVRQQRHYMSSDVFKRFTNHDGKFKETLIKDVKGLLSLYEATHLRVHNEEILEEALAFTTTHLESTVPYLSNNSLKAQVVEALRQPIRTNFLRLGARKYISIYESIDSHDDLLLRFAKLDFNILQKVHQRELNEATRWYKDLDFAKRFPYSRDRLVEGYFWAMGMLFEPQYSSARRILTKLLFVITLTDDTFDAFATFDEIVPFVSALQRCNISAMDSVPPPLRPAYQVFLDFFNELEEELAKQDISDHIYYAKFQMKRWIGAYFKEAQWLNARYTPKCDDYLKNASVTVATSLIATMSMVFMKEFINKETLEWVINDPLVLDGSAVINRLKDDILGHQSERERDHGASFIECYMVEHGVSKQEAYIEAKKGISNAWKNINEDFLRPSKVPLFGFEQVINLARLIDIFQENDFINTEGEFKEWITLLFIEPLNI